MKLWFLLLFLTACTTGNLIQERFPEPQIPLENITIDTYFCPQDNCSQHLINFIESTESYIYCQLYDLDQMDVFNAFDNLDADKRLVIDDHNKADFLMNNFTKFDTSSQLSHNKFCVKDDKYVWTGSFNPTYNGNYKNNNNVIKIKSKYLASNYLAEFDELWNGQFGEGDTVIFPKINTNFGLIENYFCPEDHCEQQVINQLNQAKNTIYFMIFSFTSNRIGNKLIELNKNLTIVGIQEKSQNNAYNEFEKFQKAGMNVTWDNFPGKLHNKVFIIDDIVITGSYNPTKNGNTNNDENILIIHNKKIANVYRNEFFRLYRLAIAKN